MKVSTKFQINPSTNGFKKCTQSDMGMGRPTDQPKDRPTDRLTNQRTKRVIELATVPTPQTLWLGCSHLTLEGNINTPPCYLIFTYLSISYIIQKWYSWKTKLEFFYIIIFKQVTMNILVGYTTCCTFHRGALWRLKFGVFWKQLD
jgi:hypothetical protein